MCIKNNIRRKKLKFKESFKTIQLQNSASEPKEFLIEMEKAYQNIEDTYEFIWGIKSHDCLSSGGANFHTMNDIDITYDKKQKTYSLSLETGYDFKVGSDGERGYIQNLFEEMTKWMKSKGYKTELKPWIYDVFTEGKNVSTEFKSIEELYTTFKCLVKGFCY